MKEVISNNEKSINILYRLLQHNFYDGKIHQNRFELVQQTSLLKPKNYRIIGVLNTENKFELSSDYKFPMNIAARFLAALCVLAIIIALCNTYWILAVPLFLFAATFYLGFTFKKKNEISTFTSKFLELYNREYEKY